MRSCIVVRETTKVGQLFTDKIPSQTATLCVKGVEVEGNVLRFYLTNRMKLLKILGRLRKRDEIVWKDYEGMIRGKVEQVKVNNDDDETLYVVEVTLSEKEVKV